MRRLAIVLGAAALATPAVAVADGNDPDFPDSSVHVSVLGPRQAKRVLTIDVTGANAQRSDGTHGVVDYGLELIVTDPAILPGDCEPTESAELEKIASVSGGGSLLTYDDLDEGAAGSFALREPYEPIGSGPLQVCAYSKWMTQDAAYGQTDVTIAPAPRTRPRSLTRPVVHRSHDVLTCAHGDWADQPASFSYRWRIGSARPGVARLTPRWAIPHQARGRRVSCEVTATNSKGAGYATSRMYRVPAAP